MELKPSHILYRDDVLVAINKPSGLVVHRGHANDRVTALSLVRRFVGQWVYPVHRLDRGTSGALIFALNPRGAARIQEQFVAQRISKRYLALTRGVPKAEGYIDHPIPRGPRTNNTRHEPLREPVAPKKDPARTYFEVREEYRQSGSRSFAWVALRPTTGRRHQLRRHMKHISHPIVGDVKYGDGRVNRDLRVRFGLRRLALHAVTLQLAHPFRDEVVRIEAKVPDDLWGPLTQMGFVCSGAPGFGVSPRVSPTNAFSHQRSQRLR